MREFVILLIASIFMLASCATSELEAPAGDFASQINGIFDEYEALDGQVFIGISGPYTDQNKAYLAATQNAYYMALFYEDLTMRVDVDLRVDTARNRDSFKVYTESFYDQAKLTDVASRLEIVDIQWVGGDVGAIVLAQYKNPASTYDESRYVYAEGTVFTYYYIQDSMFAAAYEAASNLAQMKSDLLAVAEKQVNTDSRMVQQSYQINLSDLRGFETVSYTYNPETREYTCLARALR